MKRINIKFFAVILISFFDLSCKAQYNEQFKEQLKLIDSLKTFILGKTNLKISKDFYTKWANANDSMFIYAYASRSDKVESVIDSAKSAWKYFDREDSAIIFNKKLQLMGYQTLLYKTAGASSALLSKKLLSYPNEAIAFILFHEAVHQHIPSCNTLIPYEYEEATCDAVANKFCKAFARQTGMVSKLKARSQEKIFENCYRFLNRERILIDTSHSSSAAIFKTCNHKIKSIVKNGNQFHKDRMLYEINNAYFLRIASYALHYFKIKTFLSKTDDLNKVIEKISNLTKS